MKAGIKGFGFDPSVSENHFYIVIPENRNLEVEVYERFSWDEGEEQKIHRNDVLKIRASKRKWKMIETDIAREFNPRLKNEKKPAGKFRNGGTPLEKLLGKEVMLLLWGIENTDSACIPEALRNWGGLKPEERWWLYTMTNAQYGGINDKGKGWRQALRYAICGNPIDEKITPCGIEEYLEEELSNG